MRSTAALLPGRERVEERLAQVGQHRVSVIAQLAPVGGARSAQEMTQARIRAATAELARVMAGVGVEAPRPIGSTPFVVLELDRQQLEVLARSGLAATVEVNEPVVRFLSESAAIVGAPVAWSGGWRGAGQAVAIVDDGVDRDHEFLAGRVVDEICTAPDCSSGTVAVSGFGAGRPCPDCNHGTHVAGIAAGRQAAGFDANGMAPDASIIAARVFSGTTTTTDRIVLALDHIAAVLATRHRIAAVNLSLGTETFQSATACDALFPSYAFVIDRLLAKGIAVVAASGNGNRRDGISAPACIAKAIAVGRTGDDDRVDPSSNSAALLDLLAPGSAVISSAPFNGYANLSGTSMAAPHVAGAIAVYRSRHPQSSPGEVEQRLKQTGRPITDPRNLITTPRLSLAQALGDTTTTPPPPPPPPPSGWASRGGSLLSFPDCEAATAGGSRIDCWARSTAGTLIWSHTLDGATWAAWSDLGGSLAGPPECLVRGSRMDCFVTTTAGRLAQIGSPDGQSWGAWADRGGSVADRPSCVAGTGSALDCFVAGQDRLLYRFAFDGTAWSLPQRTLGKSAIRPECVARAGGIECFTVDSARNLYTARLAGGRWGSWRKLAGGFGLAPHCLVEGSTIDCFAQSSDRQLLKGYFNGTRWLKWSKLGGSVNAAPHCNRTAGGGFDCFWTSAAFRLVRRQHRAGAWQPEADLGGTVQLRPACIARDGGARTDCLARGLDNTMQQRGL